MENNTRIIPLYEEIRKEIYLNFLALKRQHSIIISSKKKATIIFGIYNFREKFSNFYIEIKDDKKIEKLEKEQIKILNKYYNKLEKIKGKKEVKEITLLCREVLAKVGITNIEIKKSRWGF